MFDALLTQVNSSHIGSHFDKRMQLDGAKSVHALKKAASFVKLYNAHQVSDSHLMMLHSRVLGAPSRTKHKNESHTRGPQHGYISIEWQY